MRSATISTTPRRGLAPILQAYKNPDWVDRTVWGEQQRDKALAGIKYFDGVLKSSPYVAGDTFSMADITVFAGLMFADAAGVEIRGDYVALKAWRAKVSARPSVVDRSGQAFEPQDLKRLSF